MSPVRAKSFLTAKNKVSKMLHSGLAYKYKCVGSNVMYYGKTKHRFKVYIRKLIGSSRGISRMLKPDNNKLTVIQECLLCCNFPLSFDNRK